MQPVPRSPLRRRLLSGVGTVLLWCGLALPFVLFVVAQSAPLDPSGTVDRWLLPVLALVGLLGLVRRWPVAVLAVLLTGQFAVAVLGSPEDWFQRDVQVVLLLVIDLTLVLVTAVRPRRVSLAAVAVTLTVQVGAATFYPTGFATTVLLVVLGVTSAWLVGNSIRQRREYAAAQRAQAAAQAITAERLRIARELHDVIAHSIGVIAIQAGMGSRVIDSQPAEARNALRTIEDTSRETLAGLRRMLGALRREDPGTAPGSAAGTAVELAPAPGLADLDRLAARTLPAGVQVDVRWRGQRRPLPPDIDLSAFRIVQEAVTNVVRHAGTTRCLVLIDQQDGELTIEVTDDGRGGGRAGAAGGGYGIAGMRERVALLHGDFTAGPRPEGGFRVTARLPVPVAVR